MAKPHTIITSNRHFRRITGLLTLDLALFSATDVTKVPSIVVMIGFIMVAFTLYYLFLGMFSLSKLYGIEIKRQRSLVVYTTVVTAGLLALQSVGQLSQRDAMVLLPLAMVAYFYNAYAKTDRKYMGP